MKKLPMIVAIVVSIFSAQGVVAQDELAVLSDDLEFRDYEYEQQEYTEINIVELPLSIQEAAAKDFAELRIVKAYMSKDNTYKIILQSKDDNTKVVFASANGEWIKPNDNKS
ncbi:hypothetical protein IWQ47_003300 [Aquimarina sp. EL_43]|uniref:hypothetical protein n=1 Tax=Aquimarina TaxID=290174 RepID=UPI0009428134|nr:MULTISPECIES: hypothetical protein [Aquimarina]MBG6131958.1 hypothetical protein [Aquimarina sp. EL_35]MBG6149522.1 hypothetical protein [Aquimarina sp. EL_32]MBG6170215.1 hypothetical protein [Aquimarina sp. EL_43]